MMISKQATSAFVTLILATTTTNTNAFTATHHQTSTITNKNTHKLQVTTTASSSQNTDVVLYSDDDDFDDTNQNIKKNPRWKSLSPSVKEKIVKEAQERAVRNRKKREPAADKKRRMMMYYKKAQQKSKRANRTTRPLPLNSPDRTPLHTLQPHQTLNGTVISFTSFGAYIDVGTECDGLLHVSQITRKTFVEHPRQVMSLGDEVTVSVVRCSPEMKKLQLTMLGKKDGAGKVDYVSVLDDDADEDDDEERILLADLDVNDELWGQITRVTSYGAYIELGTEAQGWLHFMDHPEFEFGKTPDDYLRTGDRIRCWVANVEADRDRLKLTAIRPDDLPGPRRELLKY